VEIRTFNAEARLVRGTRFKVFEEPRAAEDSDFNEGRRRGGGQPQAAVIGDVTGDGRNDLVLLVHDRIVIYPQE
jgi:hypothetical protein